MNRLLSGLLTCILMLSPVLADNTDVYIPNKMEVTGVAVVKTPKADPRDLKGPKLGSSAIVNDRIWWEGQTIKVRKDDDSWVTLTLTKVEMVKGKGGVLTFTVELTRHTEKPTFKVTIKKKAKNDKSGYGLEKPKEKAKK